MRDGARALHHHPGRRARRVVRAPFEQARRLLRSATCEASHPGAGFSREGFAKPEPRRVQMLTTTVTFHAVLRGDLPHRENGSFGSVGGRGREKEVEFISISTW